MLLINRFLMTIATSRSHFFLSGYLLFLLIFLSGCATKPWKDPLSEERQDSAAELLDNLAIRDQQCKETLEADLALFYRSPIEKKAIEGYFKFSLPNSYKFVITNPLGQMVWAVAGNNKSYQILNPLHHQYTAGNLDSFGIKNKIPSFFMDGPWSDWITARNRFRSEQVEMIREDKKGRGIWFSMPKTPLTGNTEHLLLDPQQSLIVMRLVTNSNGSILARMSYSDFILIDQCYQPAQVEISGLDYGTEIKLNFSRIALEEERQTFKLPVPPGYFRQFLP